MSVEAGLFTPTVDRPETTFDGASHTYKVEGQDVLGVSTIAKVGGVEDTWGIASAWGFRIGYEGTWDLLMDGRDPNPLGGIPVVQLPRTKDELRGKLKDEGLTPWATRDKAAERGNWVHDILEVLGQNNRVPTAEEIERYTEEAQGHIRSLLAWYIWLRPSFVATEVQVSSREHGFAGRYDIRAEVDAARLVPLLEPPFCPVYRTDPQAERIRELARQGLKALGLLDLKTSKGIYPTTHFPQLEGYEGAGIEMGFPGTDFRAVINTRPDGSFEPTQFAVSWSTYEDFLAYLTALRAIRRIGANDPEKIREKRQEEALLAALPGRSRDLIEEVPELAGLTAKEVGYMLGRMRKRGRVQQAGRGIWERV